MSAEQIISSATSAVTGELTRILFSGLVGRFDRQAQSAAADKKLRRLEMLVIKLHSAVEASEKHTIENTWLLKWRDTLKEAATEGDRVLASFRQRRPRASAMGDDARHEQPSSSTSTTTTPSAAANTKAPPLCSNDEDIQRLNSAVERLEELSPEIGTFLKLLKLEILTPDQRTTENTESIARGAKRKRPSVEQSWKPMDAMVEASREEERRGTLLDRLEEAFAVICRAVELADGRDMRDHEWLAYWASMLREAKGQSSAVLGAISGARRSDIVVAINAAGRASGCEAAAAGCDDDDREEDSELGRFVCGMETLAGDVDYFADLACLCPSY
ncbi:hypothetical protein HU200_027729 [Digitaria exilis]|uniref:Rx N-terminal domain-containing protein n=1 Tax=Digitaria exilis TaxID=1010633 RepID=A0A835BUN0_9POAL|nr:hypothetical protein HU200_027729 [Digitaria exilis]